MLWISSKLLGCVKEWDKLPLGKGIRCHSERGYRKPLRAGRGESWRESGFFFFLDLEGQMHSNCYRMHKISTSARQMKTTMERVLLAFHSCWERNGQFLLRVWAVVSKHCLETGYTTKCFWTTQIELDEFSKYRKEHEFGWVGVRVDFDVVRWIYNKYKHNIYFIL